MRQAMQSECKPVQPKALGAIGESSLLARLNIVEDEANEAMALGSLIGCLGTHDPFNSNRHWYKKVSGMIDNVPYVFEILIAESDGATGFYHGVNHSPTFGDFLRQTTIKAGEIEGVGIAGALYEPHSEKEVQLGTFSVNDYVFPEHQFNKILYIEKKGLWHTIKAAGLHQKYDMAVIGGEGYASEAIRLLLEKAQVGQDYTIFVLHDADPDGYNIARTIQESTKRMPDHNIEVIDLGLNIQDAIDLGIPAETFTRKKALVKDLELNEIESEYFTGRFKYGTKSSYICNRVELNAMSAGQLVDYIDAGISRAIDAKQLAKKVIPGADVQLEKAAELFESKLNIEIDALIAKRLDTKALKERLLEDYADAFDKQEFKVGEYLADNELDTWSKPIEIAVDDKLEEISEAIDDEVTDWLKTA